MKAVYRGPSALAVLVAILVLGVLGAILSIGVADRPGAHLALAIAGAAVAALALAGWILGARRLAAAGAAAEEGRRALEAARAEAAGQATAAREHQERGRRLAYELKRERQWSRRLRGQVMELHERHAGHAGEDDIRTLVLKVAVDLVEAKRGLLLARTDADGDGRLDVISAVGFESDAARSQLAQRFAEEVIEQDTIVREDRPGDGASSADDEIHNLVAIPIWIRDRFSGVVVCADREGGFEACDDEVLLSLGDHAGAVLHNARLQGQLRASHVATIRLLAETIQAKDPFLRGHSEEVAEYVGAVAARLDLDPARRERLAFASLLHDVGKIGISERILLKPGRLTPEERAIIDLHPRIGFRLVEQVPGMEDLAPAILHHHERFDGSGYPGRLIGEAIPLEARVICVADAFSAMTEQRPYRDRMSLEAACDELERCAGTQFDPAIVALFVDEVRHHHRPATRGPVATALLDPDLEALRGPGEPVLGAAAAVLTDNLTLLYSHRYFHESVQIAVDRAAVTEVPFSVALVELADLGEVNRDAGYAAGDAVLQLAARALSRVAVRHGAVACRLGGACIGLLAGGLDAAATAALEGELNAELQAVPAAAGCRVAAVSRRPDEGAEALVARARATMGVLPKVHVSPWPAARAADQ